MAVAIQSRHRRRLASESTRPILGSSDFAFDTDIETGGMQAGRSPDAALREAECPEPKRFNDLALVRAIRTAAEPPRASDVATLLLIAQAVADDEAGLDNILRALKLRRPIVTILCAAKGFERSFLDLLKRGLVLPGVIAYSNGYDAVSPQALRFDRLADARWRIVTFAGHDRDGDD